MSIQFEQILVAIQGYVENESIFPTTCTNRVRIFYKLHPLKCLKSSEEYQWENILIAKKKMNLFVKNSMG